MKKRYLLLIALFISTGLFAQNTHPKDIHLKIMETSDVHGCVFPQDLVYQRTRSGSLAQVETYIKQERAQHNQSVILLDNGDILQGTPFVYYYNYVDTKGTHQLAVIMNYMKYDAGTVGNHDIEPGHEVYDKFRKELNYPWMAANAVSTTTGKPYFQPYTIIHRDGLKIAVLGMITPSIPNWLPPSIWSGMKFEDMVKTAKYWVKYIQEHEHPDLLIGLFHSGTDASYGFHQPGEPIEDASKLVAKEVPGFDVVFAGHDHKDDNEIVTNAAGKETVLLDPGAHAEHVALADIHLVYDTQTGKYTKEIKGSLVSMRDYKPDSIFMNRFMPDFIQVKKFVDRPIGQFTHNVYAEDGLFGSSAFVDLIHTLQLEKTGAQVSMVSLLSTTAKIKKGTIYVRDLFKLYRYENYLYTMSLTGKEIRDALEFSASLWFNTMTSKNSHMLLFKHNAEGHIVVSKWNGKPVLANPYYDFVSAAGINYTVDLSKKTGDRVYIISFSNGTPFDLNKTYTVAINSYQGNGGSGLLTEGAKIPKDQLAGRIIKSSQKDIRYMMMQWIEAKKVVNPEPLNQWKLIPESWTTVAEKRDRSFLNGDTMKDMDDNF
ncbi:MAG: 5'-nucleotidase C-terminal domain-containing protein [Bacteroidales bacterium]|nr:5'-nucleotidase C-terminal domain-containing protein [Bacteroidales bacterium]